MHHQALLTEVSPRWLEAARIALSGIMCRPTLPFLASLLAASASTTQAADIYWDGGAGTALWSDAANWSGDILPAGGDTVYFDSASVPNSLKLDISYPDTALPIGLVLAASHNLTIEAAPNRELYLADVTVADAHTYTLHVPRTGTQAASGAMSANGSTWDVTSGGTLYLREDFASKAFASGSWSKTGMGTLRFGDGSLGTLGTVLLQFRALGGVTELNYILAQSANGISEIAEGATVRAICYNPNVTLMLSGPSVYRAGVTGLAGTFDFNGFDHRFRALSGTTTGQITGNGGIDAVTLTLGVGDLRPSITREADGNFGGVIQDGDTGRLRVIIWGGRDGYTQVFSGANTYTGGTIVRGGTLVLGHPVDTLSAAGALTVDGGTVDLGCNSQTVSELKVMAGEIMGAGGILQAGSLTVENVARFRIGMSMAVNGEGVKRGAGILVLGGDLRVDGGLTMDGGGLQCEGGTIVANLSLRDASLTGGTYIGRLDYRGNGELSGRIATESLLACERADIQTAGLVIDGTLQAIDTHIEGGQVVINGTHNLVDWFGVNRFGGGLTYGANAVLEWTVGSYRLAEYIDGTTPRERGYIFGAIDVGGAGLVIAEGATLAINAPVNPDDTFWFTPHTFKVVALDVGASITGSFLLVVNGGADGWQATTTGDGLYLNWAGTPMSQLLTTVPEGATMPWAYALGLAIWVVRRPRKCEGRPD